MADDARVIEEDERPDRPRIEGPDVSVVLEIVIRVVDGRVVRAAEGRPHALDRRAAGGVAALPLAEGRVVLVVPDDVGAEGGPQVGVLVVVALDVERLVAAAALGHAAADEVLEGLVLIVVGPFSNIRIILQVIVRITYSGVIHPTRARELSDDRVGIRFTQTLAAGIAKVIPNITRIRNKAMLNQNTGDSLLASTTNNCELITELHLKHSAIAKAKSM